MADKEYPKHIQRLYEEQQKALINTHEQIKQWLSFKSDYEALQKRLLTLPDKISHDVMVPFGKMAFMPGQLVHTNEILVLLGENWFAERSAKQAAEIVARRIKTVDEHLEDLNKQKELLEPRQQFTSELQAMTQEGCDMVDIREEYDEEKEEIWKEKHSKLVKDFRAKCKDTENEQDLKSLKRRELIDENLWARLDQLDKIESERQELQKVGTDAEETFKDSKFPEWQVTLNQCTQIAKTEGKDFSKVTVERLQKSSKEESSYSASDEQDDLDSDDDESDDTEELSSKGTVIKFSHSINEAPDSCVVNSPNSSVIQHPGELYNMYQKHQYPTSILKKQAIHETTKNMRQQKKKKKVVAFDTASDMEKQLRQKCSSVQHQNPVEALSKTVVEKSPIELSTPSSTLTIDKPVSMFKSRSGSQDDHKGQLIQTNESEQNAISRPLSKFKAQRQTFK